MPTQEAVRWNITVSKETDLSLRSFLSSQGMKPADRAKFIEQAVLWQVLRRTVEDIHNSNRDADPEQVEAEVETAIHEVRSEAREQNILRRRRHNSRCVKVILDTNILVSALLVPTGAPGAVYTAWINRGFTLLTSKHQLLELRRTLAKPALAARIQPHRAGRVVNTIRRLALDVGPLPHVQRSVDPDDDFLLSMAEAGEADFLVTGDKSHLLLLLRHAGTRIVSARAFLDLID